MLIGTGATRRRAGLLAVLGLLLAGCSGSTSGAPDTPLSSETASPVSASPSPVSRSVAEPEIPRSTVPAPTTGDLPAGPVVPDVVRLAWLGRDPEPSGVTIAVTDGIRWQGAVPGEYAVRSGGRYRWFGADGSAVACVATDRCVGVDAAGFVAVLAGSDERWVYDPAGDGVGRFGADGLRRKGTTVPALPVAIERSGADLAALVDLATRPVPFAGGITGDPHVLTAGGMRYSTQLTGEFQARSGDPDRIVQVRLVPLEHQSDVSVVTAVAVGVQGSASEGSRGSVFQYDRQGGARLGGAPVPVEGTFRQVSVDGGPEVGLWAPDAQGAAHAAMVWADGSAVLMTADPALGLTVVVSAARSAGVGGLFGSGDPSTDEDLLDRQGVALDVDTVVRDWQLRAGESLFGERVDAVPGFPARPAVVPPGAGPFAENACRTAGLTVSADLAACVLDVGVTGDEGFTRGHLAMTRPANARPAGRVSERYPAMTDEIGWTAQTLPEIVDVQPGVGQRLVFDVPVTEPGRIGVEFVSGCPGVPTAAPAADRPAVRLFDERGRAVGPRLPTCGRAESPSVLPGRYRLVVAGPTEGESVAVRLQITLP